MLTNMPWYIHIEMQEKNKEALYIGPQLQGSNSKKYTVGLGVEMKHKHQKYCQSSL